MQRKGDLIQGPIKGTCKCGRRELHWTDGKKWQGFLSSQHTDCLRIEIDRWWSIIKESQWIGHDSRNNNNYFDNVDVWTESHVHFWTLQNLATLKLTITGKCASLILKLEGVEVCGFYVTRQTVLFGILLLCFEGIIWSNLQWKNTKKPLYTCTCMWFRQASK